ncbi:MAG TPA: serine hydrolase domain-containing protein [Actinomycetes bacterium]
MSARPLPEPVRSGLDLTLARRQAEWRSTGVAATVVRRGEPLWSGAVGTSDADDPAALPTTDTQFRIGSITKTFTAVLVMQCREEGLLDLDDPLGRHLPGRRHADLTVRRMLAHLSGLQREPVGDIWEQPEGPSVDALLAGLEDAEAVLPPARRHHYSNLAYALLGEVVSRIRREPWETVLHERVLLPLGMTRTTPRRQPPYALGYLTDPYADRVHVEPEFPGNAFAPAAELWSTTADLGRWAAFLADPAERVLHPDTVEEMCHPQVMADLDGWTLGWGLGLMLHRRGDRVLVGHDGAMPGFLAGLAVRRAERVGAAVLANTSAGADPGGLAVDLVLAVLDGDPQPPEPWRPGPPVPPYVEELLGVWWSEGTQYEFTARAGRLHAAAVGAARSRPPSVFAEEEPDLLRVVSGREQGELLRVVRREDGTVDRLYWATYPVTRDPRPFGA